MRRHVQVLDRSFGKLPARPGAVSVKLEDHVDVDKLFASIPFHFGHYGLIPTGQWGMLDNDELGDCVCAGFLHHIMLMNATAGKTVRFTNDDAVKVYEQMGGYDPSAKPDHNGDNPTDQGCDMGKAFAKWRKEGVLGHSLDSFVALRPGDPKQLWVALRYFGHVGVGWMWTSKMMDDFYAGRPIDYHVSDVEEGGHYTPMFGRQSAKVGELVSWAKSTAVTEAVYAHRSDEAAALVSLEMLIDGKTIDGFDKPSMLAALKAATAGSTKPITA